MFDSPFDFFALLIAVVAFIFARKAFNQADMLRARLDAIEATGLQARPGPPPLTAFEGLEQTPAAASPGLAAEQAEAVAGAEPVAPVAADQDAAPKDGDGATAATPPPLPQHAPRFDERLGTRWRGSASPPRSSPRFWFLPRSRTSGHCISISPSSPRRRSGWRASGCGAGSRSPPSSSRCSGPSLACNAARRWSPRTHST